MSASLASALENARPYEAQRTIALTLQHSFLQDVPQLPSVEVGLVTAPAVDAGLVGGDLWDLFPLESGRLLAVVGDVAGKGVPAAGMTWTVRAAVHALAQVGAEPAFILGHVNRLLLSHDAGEGQFVTALICVIDAEKHEFTMARAGHPGPLRLTSHSCELLEPLYGPPLGTFANEYRSSRQRFDAGDYLILYTDGVTEERRCGELFGENRLRETLRLLYNRPAQEVAELLRQSVDGFADNKLRDDLEVLVLRLTPRQRVQAPLHASRSDGVVH